MTYSLVVCDSRRTALRFQWAAGLYAASRHIMLVWDGDVPDLTWIREWRDIDQVFCVGVDPEMQVWARVQAEFLGTTYGWYPRPTRRGKEDRPENYSAVSEGSSAPSLAELLGGRHG